MNMDADDFFDLHSIARSSMFGGSTSDVFFSNFNKEQKNRAHLSYNDTYAHIETDIEDIRKTLDDSIIGKNLREIDDTHLHAEDDKELYEKYDFRKTNSLDLPIYASKEEILSKLKEFSTIIIVGSTGCGKSTQVPQIIFDDAYSKRKPCNIIVTQPRRIAARSVAERVASERGWELGSLVGYQIGMSRKLRSTDTRITFCTTGVLLEKLIHSKSLDRFSHIILDEVHERDKDMDFLLVIIRILMCKSALNVKIIIMSATIEAEKFATYFKVFKNDWMPAPIINVDKHNQFTVKAHFLEEFVGNDPNQVLNLKWQKPCIPETLYECAVNLISTFRKFDNDQKQLPSVLVFLPGIYEIGHMHGDLSTFLKLRPNLRWKIFILHSLVSSDDQQNVFRPVEKGYQKIILATNIAESSITVQDVAYVIDFCLTKHFKYNAKKNFTSLELSYASRSQCIQRMGRAGRVANGKCFRMIPKSVFYHYMNESAIPELLNIPLENSVLKAKLFEMCSPAVLLGLAMDPPKIDNIISTVLTLKELGALTPNKLLSPLIDGDLTNMGRVMAAMPIDIRATRLIMLGYCFSVLEESITIAAILSVNSMFKLNFGSKFDLYVRRLEWSNGSGSDLFASYNAFRIWTMKYNQKEFGERPEQRAAEREFCSKHGLDVRSLRECFHIVIELKKRLERLGLREMAGVNQIQLTEKEKTIILKVVISGASYPNYMSSYATNNAMTERDIFHQLNGRDPNKTVYFGGFRSGIIRELYVNPIKDIFKGTVIDENNLDRVHISIDKNSEKVFVTFDTEITCDGVSRRDWETKSCSIPGRTVPEVYKAIKMRQLKMDMRIDLMSKDNEKQIATKYGVGATDDKNFNYIIDSNNKLKDICIPKTTTSIIGGKVTHIENCSKFWFQPLGEDKNIERFKRMFNDLNSPFIENYKVNDAVDKSDTIFGARNHKDGQIYRARILHVKSQVGEQFKCIVSFIDFGYTQECTETDLFNIKQECDAATMPARCFECCLAEIQPSTMNLTGGNTWEKEAVELFKKQTLEKSLIAKIYSVVNGVVNVILQNEHLNINDLLIEQNYGEICDENYLSKKSFLVRKEAQDYLAHVKTDINSNYANNFDISEYCGITEMKSIDLSGRKLSGSTITLIGPRSPLETSMVSILGNEINKPIKIDPNSVNSVLLNPVQEQSCIRYMVAANITEQGNEPKGYYARETTLLPNIRGFGPLMAMIFCPKADLKRDVHKSRYISLLTGLGLSDIGFKPLFTDHDATFQLDFDLTNKDIEEINEIRYAISKLFLMLNECKSDGNEDNERNKLMMKLKSVVIRLLSKNRAPMEVNIVSHEWYIHGELDTDFIKANDLIEGKAIFPLHDTWKLFPMDRVTKQGLHLHCNNLYDMINNFSRQVKCKLCAIDIENVINLRIHLLSRLHKEREKQIGYERS